jgi:mannose-1-phosphate guanylyltransferase
MQAVILAGGQGTRLRPLTSTVPKPVVTLVDRPFIQYMLQWLRDHEVAEVIMSCGFLAGGVRDVLGDGSSIGIRIRYVEEPEPLGTGGAVKLAEPMLDETFLMLNGDVLTDIDLSGQLQAHRENGAQATLALVPVEDTSSYGLVLLDARGAVKRFVEKPKDPIPGENLISAGAYVLQRDVLDLIEPGKKISIERDIWPKLIGHGLYGYPGKRYWIDIGTPERYLEGSFDIVAGRMPGGPAEPVAADAVVLGELEAECVVGSGARIAAGAKVGPRAVIGPDVTIGPGATVQHSVLLAGVSVGAGARINGSILAPGASVGEGAVLEDDCVIGENVEIGAGNVLTGGARIFPGVGFPDAAAAR